jgi:cytochrome P450
MDIEVEGVTIPKGSIVFGAISAANRDPDRWPNPDIFDLHRERKPTLSFGAGPHTCIGMHLAKRELTLFLEILTRRLPSIRLDPDEPKPIIEGWMLRGVGRLPVVCD